LVVIVKRELRRGFYASELGCTSGTAAREPFSFHNETGMKHETPENCTAAPQVLENRAGLPRMTAGTVLAFMCPYPVY
jgi:hypothetical protein